MLGKPTLTRVGDGRWRGERGGVYGGSAKGDFGGKSAASPNILSTRFPHLAGPATDDSYFPVGRKTISVAMVRTYSEAAVE
jgi:hypothetical protein